MNMQVLSSEQIEGYKLLHDTFKHLTTLSTGSILLLATFLKDLFTSPEWPWLVATSIVLFLLSTIASVIVMTAFGDVVYSKGESLSVPGLDRVAAPCVPLSWVTFLLGVVALVVFSLKNLTY
jgi:hypothetical protein